MEAVLSTENSIATSAMPKSSAATKSSPVSGDSSSKRRPDQALYRPPRRSNNEEAAVKTTDSTPTPVEDTPTNKDQPTSIDDVPKSKDPLKPAKSKTARPSAEPYVPPSRRSLTNSQDSSIASAASAATVKDVIKDTQDQDSEDEEEEWEKLLNKSDDSITKGLVKEIQSKFKESVQIRKPTHDYSEWTVNDYQTKEADLAHILEVSHFPPTLRTEDLHNAFHSLSRTTFEIKWVDETHALIVFQDANAALDALQMVHPMFKVCPMSQASVASKKKVKSSSEFIQPYKARPQTTSLTANRRIFAALGMKNPISNDKTKMERQKIENARQQKLRDREEQKAVWDGAILPTSSST